MKVWQLLVIVVAVVVIFSVSLSTGCGHSSVENELIGQVKKVQKQTPIICPGYYAADVSLGIMVNGVGSYSNKDVWVVIPKEQVAFFQEAVSNGKPVKVFYDTWRVAPCSEHEWATKANYLEQ